MEAKHFSRINSGSVDFSKFRYLESCTVFHKSINMQIDLGLNIVFLVHFILRVYVLRSSLLLIFFGFFFDSSLLLTTNEAFGLVYTLLSTSSRFHPRL